MRYGKVVILVLCSSIFGFANTLAIRPTTTLTALTANNTSAANSFVAQSNGNLGANNVSKVNVHSLLYAGASTKVFAHLVLWFGGADHMDVDYSSTDAAHVHAQIEDMISRGIQGVVMVWYGPNNSIDQAAQLVMQEAEGHPGFTFALMVDRGAVQWDSCNGCAPQDALVQQLKYVEQTYFPSPAYFRINGQPVVTNFDVDLYAQIDWNAVQAALSSNPAFLFQNGGGFTHQVSHGAYSWVIPTTPDFGMGYLADFYRTAMAHANEETIGAAYKGFNDALASWGSKRIMPQQCGETWLQTFSEINSFYHSTNQLSTLQLVTWNDYEEGTEIESGIDNCVSIAGSVSGNALQWQVTGNENTLDHYAVYVSADGENLMPLENQPPQSRSLNLCNYSLAAADYTLYVQAVGKPNLTNHISAPLSYVPQCGAGPSMPTIDLTASPRSVTIGASGSTDVGLSVAVPSGALQSAASLTCSNLPAGMTCSFAPATVTPGLVAAESTLSISRNVTSAIASPTRPNQPGFLLLNDLTGFAVAGFVVMGGLVTRRTLRRLAVTAGILAGVLLLSSCGGSSGHTTRTQAGTYSVLVNAASGTSQATVTILVTVP